ncbi:glucosamine--fructose-6-phosphate aminotransferase [isomerizing] [Bacteroides sp. CAG:754]|nr:glucosamine--fructose-6-phosphate aminotransferase [isomerizing] [Bacteroides sp. CAG:754]
MCGIVGYIGKRKAYPILIKGLKRLEYRGYDSAGVALISDNQQLNVYKTKGKVSELENFVTQKDISGTIGIAHTRWATHGEPCSANAHPHYSSSEKLALIQSELPIPVGLLTGNLVPLMLILITLLPKNSLSFTTVSLKTTPFSKKNFKPKATSSKAVQIPKFSFN